MQLTTQKSQEQANILLNIAIQLNLLDIEYCIEAAKKMKNHAIRQDSILVLNPFYPKSKTDLLSLQGKALTALVDYAELLKQVDELKKQVKIDETQQSKIADMFI